MASYAQAQENYDTWIMNDTLIAGTDTLCVDTLKTFVKYAILTVSDTGTTINDSVGVEIYNPKQAVWVRVGVREMMSWTDMPNAYPGGGNTRMFLILFPAFSGETYIRQRLLTSTFTSGNRVLTSLKLVNNF